MLLGCWSHKCVDWFLVDHRSHWFHFTTQMELSSLISYVRFYCLYSYTISQINLFIDWKKLKLIFYLDSFKPIVEFLSCAIFLRDDAFFGWLTNSGVPTLSLGLSSPHLGSCTPSQDWCQHFFSPKLSKNEQYFTLLDKTLGL